MRGLTIIANLTSTKQGVVSTNTYMSPGIGLGVVLEGSVQWDLYAEYLFSGSMSSSNIESSVVNGKI